MQSAKHDISTESSPESVRSNDPCDPGGHLTGDRTLLELDTGPGPALFRCPSCFASVPLQARPERCPRCRLRLPSAPSTAVVLAAPEELARPEPSAPLAATPPEQPNTLGRPRHPYRCSGEGSCFHCDLAAHRQRVEQIGKASGRPRRKLLPGIQ